MQQFRLANGLWQFNERMKFLLNEFSTQRLDILEELECTASVLELLVEHGKEGIGSFFRLYAT